MGGRKKKSHFVTQPPKLQVPTKIHTDNTGCHGNAGASMAQQQRRNEFTDIRGFFHPLLTSFFRGSQPFWRENLISASFHLVIASLARLKVLETLFGEAVGVSESLWQNRRNKGADRDIENERANG